MIKGERLRELRDDAGITQTELGNILSVSYQTIGFYENEKVSPPNETIVAIAKYFNVSLDYLFGLTDKQLPLYKNNAIDIPKNLTTEDIVKINDYIELLSIKNKYSSKK